MPNITVIILTKNEEENIKASITSAKQIAERIIVVDSGSTDRTVNIAKRNGADIFYHEWRGHAAQFNWALDNCNIQTEWVFRLDADERISEELATEIIYKLSKKEADGIDGYAMRWRVYFMGKWIKHGGTHKPYFLRLFRYGKGRVENKLMDEHIIVSGPVKKLNEDLIHYDYKGLDEWLNKHIWYSNLELQTYSTQSDMARGNSIQNRKRGIYYRLPLFLRARLYFWYRYYIQRGFLDGKEGKILIYLQAYWYRFIVDAKICEMEKMQRKLIVKGD